MARKTKVRSDEKGLYVRADGRVFRPGVVRALVMVDMSDGGLSPGVEVQASHVGGTTRCRVTIPGGAVLYWHTEYQHGREAEFRAEQEAMQAAGIEPHAALRAILQPAAVRSPGPAPAEDANAPFAKASR